LLVSLISAVLDSGKLRVWDAGIPASF